MTKNVQQFIVMIYIFFYIFLVTGCKYFNQTRFEMYDINKKSDIINAICLHNNMVLTCCFRTHTSTCTYQFSKALLIHYTLCN